MSGPERPLPLAVDLDRDDLVALGVESLDHGTRRRERDRVLGRAPAHQHGDAAASHGVVVVSVVMSVVVGVVVVVGAVVIGAVVVVGGAT